MDAIVVADAVASIPVNQQTKQPTELDSNVYWNANNPELVSSLRIPFPHSYMLNLMVH
jgi:hypothetical protein